MLTHMDDEAIRAVHLFGAHRHRVARSEPPERAALNTAHHLLGDMVRERPLTMRML